MFCHPQSIKLSMQWFDLSDNTTSPGVSEGNIPVLGTVAMLKNWPKMIVSMAIPASQAAAVMPPSRHRNSPFWEPSCCNEIDMLDVIQISISR